jgi:hypothetical protein
MEVSGQLHASATLSEIKQLAVDPKDPFFSSAGNRTPVV